MAITESELKRCRKLKEKIELLEGKIIELEKTMIVPGCQQITGMPRGGSDSHDKIANIVARLEQLRKSYLAKLDELLELWVKVEAAIGCLDDDEEQVINLYYFSCYSWSDVVGIVGMSRRGVLYIHERALKKLSEQ